MMLLLVFSFEFHFDTLLEKWLRPITDEYFFEPLFFPFFFHLILLCHFFSINFNIQFYSSPSPPYFLILPSFQLPKMAPKFLRGDLRTTIFRRIDLQTLLFERFLNRITLGSSRVRRRECHLQNFKKRGIPTRAIRARDSSTYVF